MSFKSFFPCLLNSGIVGHNSYFGCQKCMAEGVYFKRLNRMAFPRIAVTNLERETELRTDERFRNRFQPSHHKESSILEELPIDMIRDFVTSDALHLFDLGIMKRLNIFIANCIMKLL